MGDRAASVRNDRNDEVELDLRQLWEVILRRKWYVIGTLLTALALTVVVTLFTPPAYKAGAVILIRGADVSLEALGLPAELAALVPTGRGEDLNAHVELIRSRGTLSKLRERLLEDQEYVTARLRHRVGLAFANGHALNPDEVVTLEELKDAISARVLPNSRLIRVEAVAGSPVEAVKIANHLAEAYQEVDRERARKSIQAIIDFLDKKIEETRQQLQVSEDKLAQLARDMQILLETNALVAKASRLEELLAEAQVDLEDTKAQLATVEKFLAGVKQDLFEKFAGPEGRSLLLEITDKLALIRNIQKEIADMEQEREEALRSGDYIRAKELERDIVAKRERMEEEASQQFAVLEKLPQYEDLIKQQLELTLELQALENRVAVLERMKEEEIKKLIDSGIELGRVQRELDITEDLYTLLVTQYARARIAEMGELGTVEIVDPAEPPEGPIKPNKKLNLFVGFFLGLMGGVGLAFVREALDTRFRNQDEVRAALGLPVLGLIPRIPHHRRRWAYQEISEILLTHYKPGGRIHDAFSSLVFNLRMASPDKKLGTILVTGPEPGIGKSTVASNLALALAFQRKKVLLLEADLRRPVLDRVFDSDDAVPGLTEWVVGEARLEEIVRELHPEGYGPLHIIFAGRKPPSPADFFASQAFAEVLRRLAGEYEVVVIDAPPVHAAPEIQVLATQVDAVLFLVDAEHTDKRTARAAMEKLSQAHAPVVGAVINRAPPQYFGYYGYYYYRKRYHYYADESASSPFWKRLFTRGKGRNSANR